MPLCAGLFYSLDVVGDESDRRRNQVPETRMIDPEGNAPTNGCLPANRLALGLEGDDGDVVG